MHRIRPRILDKGIRVLVVGCGATGSAFLSGLPYLHHTLLAFGHPEGLKVTVIDGDVVTPANCVRQPFSESDVGMHKAVVLVNRLNLFWGLNWKALPFFLDDDTSFHKTMHIVVGCVDSRRARATIERFTARSEVFYWLDIGNNTADGQVILGEPVCRSTCDIPRRLPTVAELYPELIDPTLDNDDLPSCSAAEALKRQAPFVNQVLANHALSLLAQLFRAGQLDMHGVFVDPKNGRANPRPAPASRGPLSDMDRATIKQIHKKQQDCWPRDVVLEAFDIQPDELHNITGEHYWP